jgi:SAM-dependent methyltransferase
VTSIDTEDGPEPAAFAVRLRSLLVCPACCGGLHWDERDVRCTGCGATYELADGIPVLRIAGRADDDAHKEQQAAFFDAADTEFETTRPHGTPWLYSWLLGEKFRRSLDGLTDVPTTAVTICGGSGMDAEFLAHTGAAVISTDISLGAAGRARERAARYGLAILPVVADAEALPLADASVDLAYVHDGLHHLEAPLAGLEELSRVARNAVSVNEPARAAATHLAIHARLSVETEEAGNRVERVDPTAIVGALERNGFSVVRCERYAMVYRHEPGRAARLLSRRPLRPLVRFTIDGFNSLLGRLGNKLTVQAVRRSPAASPGALASDGARRA